VSSSSKSKTNAGDSRSALNLTREKLGYYLGQIAHWDVLTDLPNRTQFHDRLSGALARAERQRSLAGIILVNVDFFKAININHGYAIGDRVLQNVAKCLKECARKSDTVARLGSDEFAVILEGLNAREGASLPAQRILEVLNAPMLFEGTKVVLSATIGIAVFPGDSKEPDGLLRAADAAMCDAKDHARNTYRFYSSQLDFKSERETIRHAEIERKLTSLTPREREVLEVLISGKANKMIAYLLGTSTRTIESHRARIMHKMQVASLAELIRMVLDHRPVATAGRGEEVAK
jgi:diguanylate cyclase (GGDEF)-like protein